MLMSAAKHSQTHERILLLAPDGEDAQRSAATLRDSGIQVQPCTTMEEFCHAMREGGGAGLVADECLTPVDVPLLARTLAEQPRWSDFPLIVMAAAGPGAEAGWRMLSEMVPAGTAAILCRPMCGDTLVSAAQVALRARRRQYELRDHLAERQRHERTLRESKERYRQLVESSPNAIVAASVDGRIVYANDAVLGLFAAPDLGGVIGGSFLERIDPRDQPQAVARLRSAARSTRQEEPLQCRWLRPDGTPITVELTVSPLPWEGAATVQIVLRDVSARRAEEERQRLLTELSDAMRDMESPVEVMEAAAAAMVAHLGVARAAFADVDPDRLIATRAGAHGEPSALASGTFPLSRLGAQIAAELVQGRVLVVHDTATDERTRDAAPMLAALRMRAGICAPVIGHERLRALFVVHQAQPRQWTDEEAALVEEVGRRAWFAIERARALRNLRESEERSRLVGKATNDAVWDWTIADSRIRWSEAMQALFGYAPDDIENTTAWWEERLHPDDRERVVTGLTAAIRGVAEHWSDEYRFRRLDGSYAHVLDRGYTVRTPSGEPVRMIGAMLDVSERREAEEAMRASEARFRQLADSMPQIVWSAEADGQLDYCNRRWYELAGEPPCEDGDDPWARVLHPEDAQMHAASWRISVRTGQPFQHEYRVRDAATGLYHWHLGRAVPVVDERGRVVRWYGSSTDIDDQKLAQQRLTELVDELNRSNRELEDFAHIASHDLKEPLRGIRNYSSFLIEDYGDILDAEGHRKLRTIDRLGKRMDDLISSLLYYSQVGRTEMAIEDTDLNQIVLEVLESLGPTLSERGVDVRLPRPLPTVRCDRVRVAEVYRNLLTNSMKYNDKPDPWVEISWSPPSSSPGREGAWPVLYVRDNGIGIPAKHFGTVFGIFKRLHGRDEYDGGTGSGLAFVKRIIERHRGRIWIESTEGEGTTFRFTLGREEHAAVQTAHPHR